MVDKVVSFLATGNPVTEGSLRARVIFPKDRSKKPFAIVHHDDPKGLDDWRNLVGNEAQKVANGAFGFVDEGPVAVTLSFRLRPPKALAKWRRVPWGKPDSDKLARACLDALKGKLYKDDGQVACLIVTRVYALTGPPGVRVRLVRLEDVERDTRAVLHENPEPEEMAIGYAIIAAAPPPPPLQGGLLDTVESPA